MKEHPTPLPGGAISRPLGNIKERLGTGLPTNRFFSAELLLVWPEMQFKGVKPWTGHVLDISQNPLFFNFYRVSVISTPSPTYPSSTGKIRTIELPPLERPDFCFRHFHVLYYRDILGFSSSTLFFSITFSLLGICVQQPIHRQNTLSSCVGRNFNGNDER